MKLTLSILAVALVIIGVVLYLEPQKESLKVYTSETYDISFSYPAHYFIYEPTIEGAERIQHALVLMEDTPENRALVAGESPGREGPTAITVSIYQNNLDNYTTEGFIRDTNFSNFKLSDGILASTTVGGESALRYRSTGLYENESVVVARPAWVYMFTASFNAPTDSTLTDFDPLLKTVKFGEPQQIPTSADNAPPGSIHNLPVPKAVAAVRAHVATKLGVSEGVVIVISAYEKEWSDSCLGLGGPAESCAFVITKGYEVTTQAGGIQSIFRTNTDGSVIRQEL